MLPHLSSFFNFHNFLTAVTSCNDVIAIFLFGVLLGIAFSTGNLTQKILQGPVGIVMGCVFGAVSGLVILKFPSDKSVCIFISFHFISLSRLEEREDNAIFRITTAGGVLWKKRRRRGEKNCFQFKMQNATLFLYLMMILFLHFFLVLYFLANFLGVLFGVWDDL
jgi:hypothetical protein